jgi:hypothetical protein
MAFAILVLLVTVFLVHVLILETLLSPQQAQLVLVLKVLMQVG